MLTMSAPKKFFIGPGPPNMLEPSGQKINRLPATRDAAPRRGVGREERTLSYAVIGRLNRRKGHFQSAGGRNQAGCFGGFHTVCVSSSRANPWLEMSGPVG